MKWKSIDDNFGRRAGRDRRRSSNPDIKVERRSGKDRRVIPDRRQGIDRRQNEGANEIDIAKQNKRSQVDRRDFIYNDNE